MKIDSIIQCCKIAHHLVIDMIELHQRSTYLFNIIKLNQMYHLLSLAVIGETKEAKAPPVSKPINVRCIVFPWTKLIFQQG